MTPERLVAFLYILMRDHVPSGVVETIMMQHVELPNIVPGCAQYSNQHLHRHAVELAERLEKV